MLVSRTPFRVSFFGGGTDYPTWFQQNGGAVVSCTLRHYCYVSARFLPPFFEHRSRIVWSKIELVDDNAEIEHRAIRAALNHLGIARGVEIHHQGDLPARSGIGSSSSFSVGLLAALHRLSGRTPSKHELARDAIELEQAILKENVGVQDQIAAAFGGLNRIDIARDGGFEVTPLTLSRARRSEFLDHLMLFYTGISRYSTDIARETIKTLEKRAVDLGVIAEMVDRAVELLSSDCDLAQFGPMLHESWLIKRSLTSMVSTSKTDEIYEIARAAGATGGKLLGAGGGGFMLFFVPVMCQPAVADALSGLTRVPFEIDDGGVKIVYRQRDD